MSPSYETMRDIRVSIIVAISDEPNASWTAQKLHRFFEGSGYETELRWVEEALHQLLWVDVLTKRDRHVYIQGEKFHQYREEMLKYIEPATTHGDLHGGREDTRQDS